MRNLVSIISLMLLAVTGFAQQRTQSSFNYLNTYNFNKSYAGLDTCSKIFFQHKNQWVGVDDAPANTFLQGHTKLPWNFGVGVGINRWSAGLLSQFDASVALAKHFVVKQKITLSPSVNVGYARYTLNADDAVAFDSDTYLNQSRTSTNSFYADFGFLVTYDRLEAGVSIPRAITTDAEFDVSQVNPTMNVENYFNAHASYDFEVKDVWNIKPMLIYRSIPENGQMLDIMAAATYNNKIGVALGYRTNSGFLASANYNIKDMFTIGYGYDVGMQQVAGLGSGSHEVLLGFKVCRSPKEPVKKEVIRYYLSGQLTDNENGETIANAQVNLKDATSGLDTLISSDSTGNYQFEVAPNRAYQLTVDHPDYVTKNIELISDSNLAMNAKNMDLVHKQVLVNGNFKDVEGGQSLDAVTALFVNGKKLESDAFGDVSFKANEVNLETGDNTITFSKEGYHDTTATVIVQEGNYDPVNLSVAMRKVAEPKDAPVIVDNKIEVNPIYFEVGSSTISQESLVELDRIVEYMNANTEVKVEVNAHTDCTGSAAGNQRLSDLRAKACVSYISGKITNPERITGKGFGESKPLTDCACAECGSEDHAKNRRTEFVIQSK